jgi:hypothetical protein
LIREKDTHWKDGRLLVSITHVELAVASKGSLDPHCSCHVLEKLPFEVTHVLFRKDSRRAIRVLSQSY